jgi:hypothetical protein
MKAMCRLCGGRLLVALSIFYVVPILLHAQNDFSMPPKGVNSWYGVQVTNEWQVMQVISNMVSSGMVKCGYNTFLFDAGPPTPGVGEGDSPFSLVTNNVLYAALTNNGWLDFDPVYYPHGAQWLVNQIHTNGCRVILYAFNGQRGGLTGTVGTNTYYRVQPGAFGTDYYLGWLSNAIVNWKIDGLKDEASGASYANAIQQQTLVTNLSHLTGIPFYVNVATSAGYQPWYQGLFNSWRIGVGLFSDVATPEIYYEWLDQTPFAVAAPGSYNDLDEMYYGSYWIPGSLNRNELAMDTMANAALFRSGVPATQKNDPLMAGYYYNDFDNPLVSSIDNDFTSPVQLVSSNALLLTYAKRLRDGTYAICVQNRSYASSQTATLPVTNFYPAIHVVTIHDCFRNAPTSAQTNNCVLTVPAHDVAWFKLIPGIEQVFPMGTNDLTQFPWSDCYHVGMNTIQVNQWGDGYTPPFPYAVNYNPANGTNQTGLIFPITANSNSVSWFIGGNATKFTVQLGGAINNVTFNVLGDGAELWSGIENDGQVTNLNLSVAGVNLLSIVMTNNLGNPGYNTAYAVIGTPELVCNSQFNGMPKLTISRAGNQVTVSWPSAAINFVLQQNTGLAPTGWTASDFPVTDDGTNKSITITASAENLFFRLSPP